MPLKITDPAAQVALLNKWAAEIEKKLSELHRTSNSALKIANRLHKQANPK